MTNSLSPIQTKATPVDHWGQRSRHVDYLHKRTDSQHTTAEKSTKTTEEDYKAEPLQDHNSKPREAATTRARALSAE